MSDDFQHELLLKREEEKRERAKARLRANEENMKQTLANLLKQDEVRKAVGMEIIDAHHHPERYSTTFKRAASGSFQGEVDSHDSSIDFINQTFEEN